jgi:hypothetical protein
MAVNLEKIADNFRKNGLLKQAVLLESNNGLEYGKCLIKSKWESVVEKKIGKDNYSNLKQQLFGKNYDAMMLLKSIFSNYTNEDSLEISEISIDKLNQNEVKIDVESQFDLDVLVDYFVKKERLKDLSNSVDELLYSEFKQKGEQDNSVWYNAYNDSDSLTRLKNKNLEDQKYDYLKLISQKLNYARKKIELNAPSTLVTADLIKNNCYFPDLENIDAWSNKNIQQYIDTFKVKYIDNDNFENLFKRHLEFLEKNKEKRILGDVKEELFMKLDYFCEDYDPSELVQFIIHADDLADLYNMNQHFYEDYLYSSINNEIKDDNIINKLKSIFKLPINIREELIDVDDLDAQSYNSTKVGLQQLLDGGLITNPSVHETSILQNDAYYPNIKYSKGTLDKLKIFADEYINILDNMSEIQDLAAPSKIKNKKNLTYTIREHDKNPLDVTFGNDSGCCIFVPYKLDQMQNGEFVPNYINNNHTKIFSIYRKDKNKERRMGMVLAFETQSDDNKKYLACNSIELSRKGVIGGKNTVNQVVNHVEDWLIQYAKLHNYDGITMGGHSYNTSVNHSTKIGDKIDVDTKIIGQKSNFYSDILEQGKVRKTSYWLWKK